MEPTTDYRDLPIQVAREAAQRNREQEIASRERWAQRLRTVAGTAVAIAGIAAVALTMPSWRPILERQREALARALDEASADATPVQDEAAGGNGPRNAGRESDRTAPVVATVRNAARTAGASPPRVDPASDRPVSTSIPSAGEAVPAQPPAEPPVFATVASSDAPVAKTADTREPAPAQAAAPRRSADDHPRRNRLQPVAAGYRALLESDNDAARRGLENVTAARVVRMRQPTADAGFDSAEKEPDVARKVEPDATAVGDAAGNLERARASARVQAPPVAEAARQGQEAPRIASVQATPSARVAPSIATPGAEPGWTPLRSGDRRMLIADSPVTHAQYARFAEATRRESALCRDRGSLLRLFVPRDWRSPGFPVSAQEPVVCVSWQDAQAYARWRSDRDGRRYRLAHAGEARAAPPSANRRVATWSDACGTEGCEQRITAGRGWRGGIDGRALDGGRGYDDVGFRLVRDLQERRLGASARSR